jgi:hypothetical protein
MKDDREGGKEVPYTQGRGVRHRVWIGWQETKLTLKNPTRACPPVNRTCHEDVAGKGLGLDEKCQHQGHEVGALR